jgi:cytochrome c-type protein NapB
MIDLRILAASLAIAFAATAVAAQTQSALRGSAPLNDEADPPPLPPPVNTSEQPSRNYPEQPPIIPHSIEGYRIDLDSNKCLSCHARSRTAESGAPMLSVTHFMDREGQVLASVSPRRYFCTQCHVPQFAAKPPVANDFVDVDSLITPAPPGARR